MPTATCPHLWPTTMPREGSHISAHTERCWDPCRGKRLLKCLAAAIPSRERNDCGRGLPAQDPTARRRVDAVPAGEPGGDRRDEAAAAGQGSAADAAVP